MMAVAGLLFLLGFLLALAGGAEKALAPVTTPGFFGCMILGGLVLFYKILSDS